MDVKYVPEACYVGVDGDEFYQYTMIEEVSMERFIYAYMAEGDWSPRIQAKLLLRHLTIDLLNSVKFTSFFTCVDMIEALNGKVGDLSSYLDYGYFGILGADFDENGVATGEYTPKPSYYALQNLASLLEGNLTEEDLPLVFHKEPAPYLGKINTVAGYEATYGGFRLYNGSLALAYWKACDLMTMEYLGSVSIETALSSPVHLVDPMDGTVYEPENVKNEPSGITYIKKLPIKDYPMFLVFGELEFDK